MKTTLYTSFIIILFASLFYSCEDILNTELKGSYTTESFFVSDENAILAVNAAYRPLSFATEGAEIWVIGDTRSDDAIKGGDAGDKADAGDIDEFVENTNNGVVATLWANYYEGITRSNYAIKNINAMSPDLIDTDLKSRLIGEAKFLRAYYYFLLVNIYGDVPVLLEPKLTSELQIAPSTVSEIYNQIEQDCSDALEVLPVEYSSTIEIGRATQGAALALLAKSYLYQEKWQDAYETALLLTQAPYTYQLMPNYQHNFNVAYENNSESIFEIQHLSRQDPFSGNLLNQAFAAPADYGMGEGYYFNLPTQNFVDEFETVDITGTIYYDPRLDYTIGRENAQLPWIDDTIAYSSDWTETGYIAKKELQPISEIPGNIKGDGELNYTAIRYADVLLWIAEAYNEDNKSAMALPYLNSVRKRARECFQVDENLVNYPDIPTGLLDDITETNQNTLRDIIRHERRTELGFEFHRYFDIMRYGEAYANNVFGDVEHFNYQENRYLPYPQRELDTNYELRNYSRN
ncbi:MAG: RagB/SusD family nutrient uptake outer membrane protein [Bacteroidales bacterium]|nr:RagB/SusD family nutrient uptake outer membrane protein [Bacteroidales bacterium]